MVIAAALGASWWLLPPGRIRPPTVAGGAYVFTSSPDFRAVLDVTIERRAPPTISYWLDLQGPDGVEQEVTWALVLVGDAAPIHVPADALRLGNTDASWRVEHLPVDLMIGHEPAEAVVVTGTTMVDRGGFGHAVYVGGDLDTSVTSQNRVSNALRLPPVGLRESPGSVSAEIYAVGAPGSWWMPELESLSATIDDGSGHSVADASHLLFASPPFEDPTVTRWQFEDVVGWDDLSLVIVDEQSEQFGYLMSGVLLGVVASVLVALAERFSRLR